MGVVLFFVGIILLATAGVLLFWPHLQLPQDVIHSGDRLFRSAAELFAQLSSLRDETGEPHVGAAVLMPESPVGAPTPLPSAELPSLAAAAEAPTTLAAGYRAASPSAPVRLTIPSLDIDAPVRPVRAVRVKNNGQRMLQWEVPDSLEAGWHQSSAPLGQPGNTVINGHNNVHGEIFRDLIDLAIGEVVILHDARQQHAYQVVQRELLPESDQPLAVRLQNARFIESTVDERITLVSCWPYATNSHRIIIIAKPFGREHVP
ncbi:MAG: sortase [Candidatus Promineifilaceae bacterium]|nr:sortase [Candidatus Promineifilaceae bacterium]